MPRWLVFCLIGVGATVALVALGTAMLMAGVANPAARRDRDREAALYAVTRMLHERYAGDPKAELPTRVATGPDVAYRSLGRGEYQLCTTFEQERDGGTGTWAHSKGRNCFQFSVYGTTWMDPTTRRWVFPTC
jgi:hypothetical protein